MEVDNSLAPVPESWIKDKEERRKLRRANAASASHAANEEAKLSALALKRAKQYELEHQNAQSEIAKARADAVANNQIYVFAEPKLAIVIRIRGILNVPPKPRKVLQLLRLVQLHNAVFVRLTVPTINMLKIIEPYIAYGYPSLETVRKLIYKRGYMNINKQRIPIDCNQLISSAASRFNIVCLEDIVHEIFTVGSNFTRVNRLLWPFKLDTPRGGFDTKLRSYVEGGEFGNREHAINRLVSRMI